MVVANIKNGGTGGEGKDARGRKITRLIPLFNSFNGPSRRTNYNYLPGNAPEIDLPNDNITDTRAGISNSRAFAMQMKRDLTRYFISRRGLGNLYRYKS